MEFCKIKNVSVCSVWEIFKNMVQNIKKDIFNIPNALSVFRVLLIFPFAKFFLKENYLLSIIILLVSGLTDMLDGLVARKTMQITRLGKILDPLADKLTLIAVMLCLGAKFKELAPFVSILLIKDISMVIAAGVFLLNGIDPPKAQWFGKASTAVFYISALVLILLKVVFCIETAVISVVLFSVTTAFMIFALVKYFLLCLKLIKN